MRFLAACENVGRFGRVLREGNEVAPQESLGTELNVKLKT
jgi:hypothetical protein